MPDNEKVTRLAKALHSAGHKSANHVISKNCPDLLYYHVDLATDLIDTIDSNGLYLLTADEWIDTKDESYNAGFDGGYYQGREI